MRCGRILILLMILALIPLSCLADEGELEISIPFTGVYLQQGSTLTTSLYVKSNFSYPISVDLCSEAPRGWNVTFRSYGYDITSIYLTPKAEKSVELKVKPPDNEEPGDYTIAIYAKYGNVLSNRINLTIHLQPKPQVPPFELRVPYMSLRGQPGSTLDYRFDIKNNLDKDIVVGFNIIEAPEGWGVSFKPSTYENRIISSVTIRPKDTQYGLVLSVNVPKYIPPGDYKIKFSVSTEGYTKEVDLTAKVSGIKEYRLTTPNGMLSFEVQAGEVRNITLSVINEGTDVIQDIELTTSPPPGWEVKVYPEKIDILKVGETKSVTLTLQTPSNTLAGDYSLRVSAWNIDAGRQTLDLRITVTKQTYWGIIGILVVVLSITTLILVFWRFGRP